MAKGLAVGLNKGHVVSKIEKPSRVKVQRRKQNEYNYIARKRVAVIRQVIHEICGHKPYERKIMELLKQSKANTQKKAYKLAKKSLGTHKRALRKRNELQEAVQRHEH